MLLIWEGTRVRRPVACSVRPRYPKIAETPRARCTPITLVSRYQLANPSASGGGDRGEVRPEELVHHVGPRTTGPEKVLDVGFGLCGYTNSRERGPSGQSQGRSRAHLPLSRSSPERQEPVLMGLLAPPRLLSLGDCIPNLVRFVCSSFRPRRRGLCSTGTSKGSLDQRRARLISCWGEHGVHLTPSGRENLSQWRLKIRYRNSTSRF